MEIEQKYVVHIPDNIDEYEYKDIIQGYLCTEPVVRIRKSNDRYILTYKSNRDSSGGVCKCEELEAPLSKESFEHLLKKCDGEPIVKRRIIIPLDEHVVNVANVKAELDIFGGILEGLVFAEVEFPDEEAVKRFNPPDWFVKNVSDDVRYRNSYLTGILDRKEYLELFK